ncbi:MAG: fatty acid kinase [Actinomycetota bacterium]|jgi:DAK2 domain fusion protein YloV|nr:fatty acid kinase [Actinomycetota bacterium]
MSQPPPPQAVDGAVLHRWAAVALHALEAARAEIDELNVYPVPDGDTGTNLHLTLEAAVLALGQLPDGAAPGETLGALSRGALLGARGNSGVILSQVLRGMAETAGDRDRLDPATWATALGQGSEAAYAAVADPVEGTMLTVAREAARAAAQYADGDLAAVVVAAADAARAALARTPEQLEVLRLAGVVDAGGRGVCVLLDALVEVVTGTAVPQPGASATATGAASALERFHGSPHEGPAYEVMYLLDAPQTAIPALRSALSELGDALVVVGGEPTWNVHVHVDDVGLAIEAGVEAGRPHRIRVTSFRDAARAEALALPDEGRGVVSVVAGQGLGALFETAGATVVPGGPGRRASTGEILAGVRATRRRDVIVLPNDADSLAVAQAAAAQARDEGLRVAVIPTRASVQALAALAVHDAARRFEDDVVAMTAAANHCRHGGVTVASREAVTMAGVCQVGDVLGIVDGDFAVIGDDLSEVARAVVDRMLGSGGELVTVVTGADGQQALAEALVRHLHTTRPEVDTLVYDGGQPRYPLLIGVE